MIRYYLTTTEFERGLHGNRAIVVQTPVSIGDTIMLVALDWRKHSAPVQTTVRRLYGNTFKGTPAVGVAIFPFAVAHDDNAVTQAVRDYYNHLCDEHSDVSQLPETPYYQTIKYLVDTERGYHEKNTQRH